tara:strand:+ start:416 stop:820 length:405 start_codon:yes stop_codon:yes gene_type:complete
MYKKIEKQILDFVDTLDEVKRREIVHGTLYVTLEDDRVCDIIHTDIRDFYRKKINPEGGVNMYAVGDEFAFDFVPEDRETPVFSDEEYSGKEGMMPDDIDKGIWSDFAEEGLIEDLPDDVDTLLELENDMKRGK